VSAENPQHLATEVSAASHTQPDQHPLAVADHFRPECAPTFVAALIPYGVFSIKKPPSPEIFFEESLVSAYLFDIIPSAYVESSFQIVSYAIALGS
jgi:hypothetical protein